MDPGFPLECLVFKFLTIQHSVQRKQMWNYQSLKILFCLLDNFYFWIFSWQAALATFLAVSPNLDPPLFFQQMLSELPQFFCLLFFRSSAWFIRSEVGLIMDFVQHFILPNKFLVFETRSMHFFFWMDEASCSSYVQEQTWPDTLPYTLYHIAAFTLWIAYEENI